MTLVLLQDLDGLGGPYSDLPAHRRVLDARDPALTRLMDDVGLVQISERDAERLSSSGVATHTVGFDRRSDGWWYVRRGRAPLDHAGTLHGVASAVLAARGLEDVEDPRHDQARDELGGHLLDAIVGVLSDGVLDERRVVVASMLPPIGGPVAALDVASILASTSEASWATAEPALFTEVRTALATSEADPPQAPIATSLPRWAFALLGAAFVAIAILLAAPAPAYAVVAAVLALFFFALASSAPRRGK